MVPTLSPTIWFLRQCPKCRGDMTLETDLWGEYKQCLQCGLVIDTKLFLDELTARSEVASLKKQGAHYLSE